MKIENRCVAKSENGQHLDTTRVSHRPRACRPDGSPTRQRENADQCYFLQRPPLRGRKRKWRPSRYDTRVASASACRPDGSPMRQRGNADQLRRLRVGLLSFTARSVGPKAKMAVSRKQASQAVEAKFEKCDGHKPYGRRRNTSLAKGLRLANSFQPKGWICATSAARSQKCRRPSAGSSRPPMRHTRRKRSRS